MYGYIYKTINSINNKIYIGQHKSAVFDDKYYGSGKYLRNALNKYGISNFYVDVLATAETKEDLDELEKYWISYFRSLGCDMYNIANGGEGGDVWARLNDADKQLRSEKLRRNSYFSNLSKEERQEMSKKTWKARRENGTDVMTPEQRKKLSEAHKGHKVSRESILKRIDPRRGYTHSLETKEKISRSNMGKEVSQATREKMSAARKGKYTGKDNSFYGKHHSAETRAKIAEMNRAGICGMKGKHLTEEQKRHHSESMKGKNSGTRWMNDGKKCFKVKEADVSEYLLKGYYLGRKVEGCSFVSWNKGLRKENL